MKKHIKAQSKQRLPSDNFDNNFDAVFRKSKKQCPFCHEYSLENKNEECPKCKTGVSKNSISQTCRKQYPLPAASTPIICDMVYQGTRD